MKTSYSHLPDYAKNDLQQIVSLILERVPHCEMIILYGSYARGTFVEYDERDEFGILTSFMSDYDLLVVTSNEDVREVGHLLDTVDDKYYKRPDNQVGRKIFLYQHPKTRDYVIRQWKLQTGTSPKAELSRDHATVPRVF